MQLYADDAVIFTQAKNSEEAAQVLLSTLTHIQDWLTKSCLLLNTKKIVYMHFSKHPTNVKSSNVFLGGEVLMVVKEFRYLGVMLDSALSFKSHVTMMSKTIKYNLYNFRQIRRSLIDDAAMMFLHSMIFSHMDYCLTSWSLAEVMTL